MEIAKVAQMAAITPQNAAKPAGQTAEEKTTSTLAADNADKFIKSDGAYIPAYTKKSAQRGEVELHVPGEENDGNAIKEKTERMMQFTETLVSKQANKKKELRITLPGARPDSNMHDDLAAEPVSVKILEYALSLAAGDPSTFEALEDAFKTGFSHCEGLHGGKASLHEECYDTYDRVTAVFEHWKMIRDEQNAAQTPPQGEQ